MPRAAALSPADQVEQRLASFPDAQRKALQRTWQNLRRALPGAEPAISYGLPTLQVDGISVVAVDGFKRHNSLFPYSGSAIAMLATHAFATTKGSIHFPLDQPFPAGLTQQLVRLRIDEINASFPNRSGIAKQFHPNGFRKATGRVRDGQPHGDWSWFRRDGSLLRTGSFRKGTRVGSWTSYDLDGKPVRSRSLPG